MSSPTLVDAAVIGTGQAGPSLATGLASRGLSVALFEGGALGGSCVNVGCTPTKTLRKTARVAHLARRAADFGVQVGDVRVDLPAALARMRGVVTRSRNGLEGWITGTPGVSLVREWARVEGRAPDGRFVVRAGDAQWHATHIYLNVGTAPSLPPTPGLADVDALTNDSLLALNELPAELVVIGGSYIGLELGQLYARLGSRVTILEAGPAVASREDPDVSARIATMLEAEGLHIAAGVKISSLAREPDGRVAVTVRRPDRTSDERVTGTHLLVATGRRPCTDGLGLDTVGVAVDAQGYVPVNGALETSVAGVFALGDVNRRGAFTHTSYQDYEIVLANHDGTPRTADGRITTYAMYTDPPLGRIGMSETEARHALADGRHFLQTTIEMAAVSRAKEEGETTGVIKLLVDGDTHRFAGITMLGIGADEVVQVIAAMMAADAPYEVLRDFLPIHPTITEFFPTMLGRLKPFR